MDKIRIAGKLVKLAKEIISSNNNVADKEGIYKNFSGIINFKNKKGKEISGIGENADFQLSYNSVFPIYWRGGTWKNGIWIDGWWENGTWEKGKWWGGNWFDGTWEDGWWIKGTWVNGTWKCGKWCNGIWENGTWIDGKDGDGEEHTVNPNEW